MKTICLYFQVHQPFRLRRYRFFEIGNDHYYYDDYSNESIMHKVADKCYLPANKVLLSLIREYGEKFKVAFSISGVALDQFELYTPDVLKSFKELADTGCVEFLSETYSHSLVSLKNEQEFKNQVEKHKMKIKELFGQEPTVFRNTELVYSDDIGAMVAKMGYQAMLTEGAKHILGWKSPNYLYCNTINPKLKVLLKNFKLSDDIAFRFGNKEWSEYPLTAEKYVSWLQDMNKDEEIINLFMDYETFGEHQWADTGIFKFLESFPKVALSKRKFSFSTPSEVAKNHQPVSAIQAPYPVSWADAERDLTAWLGNELQTDAFNTLYELTEKVSQSDDPTIHQDWEYLQCSDHFYYMCTKFFSDGDVHSYFNPYDTPYDAYINYMNILNDFIIRVNASVPETTQDKEVARLSTLIREKDKQLEKYEAEIKRLTKRKTPVRKKAALTKAAESSKKSTSKKTALKSTKGSKIKGTK
ncbi:MAG: glycoside hydrolase family 57 protein [Bacteroidota bacterium]